MAKVLRLHEYKEYADISGIQLDDIALAEPDQGEIRIKVDAFSLNYGDFELFANKYMFSMELPTRFGDECSGVVDAIGEGVENFRIGDKVSTLPWMNEGYGVDGEFAIVPASFVAHYPCNLSPEEACCIWVAYLTAYFALFEVAQIQSTDYVLITAGSSSAGMATMELCRMMGAKTIGTTRTGKNLGFLKEVGFDHAIAQSDQNMSESILDFSGGKGACIVYDPIGGGILQEYAEGLAQNAEIFLYGGMSHEPTILPEIPLTQKAACLRPFSVYNHIYDQASRERGIAFVYNALKQGYIKSYVEKVYPMDDFRQAFLDQLQSTSRKGKMVISTKD
ncbi:zinc-dependent alcohol dehydrogenase family protein [Ekhidna sp.]|uniref:zinc-dependent alcohol dehydrogenase family protein n=1 Tax=Ekhidna sp. TaxID=2608089 RepID=UPI003299AA55